MDFVPQDAEHDQMLDLAQPLAALDDGQWDSSLCTQWRIRDVLAHATAGAEGAFGVGAIVRGMLRHGFHYNRWVAADGRIRGQQDPAVILEALRIAAANRKALPRDRPVRGLIHVQDMCRPLGIKRYLPEIHLVPVADFIKDDVRIFGTKKRIAGLKLTATDMDWSQGNGPEVTGPAEGLVMMMAGRLVALDDLSGEGRAALVARH